MTPDPDDPRLIEADRQVQARQAEAAARVREALGPGPAERDQPAVEGQATE